MSEQPEPEYGEWARGNAGQVGRVVIRWMPAIVGEGFIAVADWEPHPDETERAHHWSEA